MVGSPIIFHLQVLMDHIPLSTVDCSIKVLFGYHSTTGYYFFMFLDIEDSIFNYPFSLITSVEQLTSTRQHYCFITLLTDSFVRLYLQNELHNWSVPTLLLYTNVIRQINKELCKVIYFSTQNQLEPYMKIRFDIT